MVDIPQMILTVLGTGTAIEVVRAVVASRKQSKDDDTSLVMRDRGELQEIRHYFATEAENLKVILERIKEEKHGFELKALMLERDLKDERRFSSEQAEEILLVRAECDRLTRENAHFTRLGVFPGTPEMP